MKAGFFLTLAAASLCLLDRARAEEHFDFERDRAGAIPQRVSVNNPNRDGNEVCVVDASSEPADPFGGSNNQSVYLSYRAGEPSRVPWIDFPVGKPDAPVAAGNLTMDLFVPSTGDSAGLVEMDFGPHAAKDVAPAGRSTALLVLQIVTGTDHLKAGTFRFYAEGKWVDFKQSFPLDVKNRLSIRWNADEHTVEVALNDMPLTYPGGASGGVLPFQNASASGASYLRLMAAGQAPAACFLDNLRVSSQP